MQEKYKIILLNICAIFMVLGGVILAGTITRPTNTPTITFYTLDDIYGRLTDGGYTLSPDHDLLPLVSTNSNTMYSLEDIYDAIPTHRALSGSTTTMPAGIYLETELTSVPGSGLSASNIASGTEIFGVVGTF